MAIHTIKKQRSWPSHDESPNVQRHGLIDQNPFAYFVSCPADQSNLCSDESLVTAGISPPPRRSHSLSPDLRKTRAFLLRHGSSSSPTLKLKQWVENLECRYFHRSPRIIEIRPRDPHIGDSSPQPISSPTPVGAQPPLTDWKTPQSATVSPPLRGRKDLRAGSKQRDGRRRPRVWTPPSEDLFTVAEEGEGEGMGLGIISMDEVK